MRGFENSHARAATVCRTAAVLALIAGSISAGASTAPPLASPMRSIARSPMRSIARSPVRSMSGLGRDRIQACRRTGFVQRTGRPGCWVTFGARDSAGRELRACLRRDRFGDILRGGWPLEECGAWEGRLRRFSPPSDDGVKLSEIQFDLQRFVGSRTRSPDWRLPIERLREQVSLWLAPHDSYAILRRLVVGESSPSPWPEFLRFLGLVHLLVASGIHLYVLLETVRRGVRWGGGAWWPGSVRGLRALSTVAAAVVWFAAWLLSGARPGMLRPLLLVTLRTLAQSLGMRWRAWFPLLAAIAIDLGWAAFSYVLDPSSHVWAPGRLTYALAVGGGFMALQMAKRGDPSWGWRSHVAMALGSWVGVAILELCLGQPIAVLTPVLSLVSLPLFATIVYPAVATALALFALGFHSSAEHILRCVGRLVDRGLDLLLPRMMQIPDIVFVSREALAVAALLGALSLLATRRARGFWQLLAGVVLLRLALTLPIVRLNVSASRSAGPPGADRISQLDVSQGDAALIEFQDAHGPSAGLIDTGSLHARSAGQWITTFLRAGVTRLRFVFLTHLDEDHAGGLQRLAQFVPIDCVWMSERLREDPKGAAFIARLQARLGAPLRNDPRAPIRIESGRGTCVPFAIWPGMRPPARSVASRSRRPGRRQSQNVGMGAMIVPSASRSHGHPDWVYLAFGDAHDDEERASARWAVDRLAELAADSSTETILKISHHGSRFSSPTDVLRALHPSRAWISAGVGNRYGHPTLDTLGRLRALGIPVERTDLSGTLRWPGPARR